MYEDEFELTFQVPEEESAPEPLAAPVAKPAAPVEPVVDAITPVPGGVGAVASSVLLAHTVRAAELLTGEGCL